MTNVCCESTARDAMMLNFRTIMVTDGNAAVTDEDHNASLIAFYLTRSATSCRPTGSSPASSATRASLAAAERRRARAMSGPVNPWKR